MERKKLSPAVVNAAKPGTKPYRIRDITVPELFLRVQPSGVKSWNVQWSRNTSRALGKWPGVTVAAARTKAHALLVEVGEHGAPEALRKGAAQTLADYLAQEYGPWVRVNRKDGANTLARLETTFSGFLKKPLADINPWIVEKWRSKRLKAGIAPATVNRDLTALKACLSKAVEWGQLDAHPLAKVKPCKVDTQGKVRHLSPTEETALRTALLERDEKMIRKRVNGNTWRAERGYTTLPVIPASGYGDHLTPMVLLALNTGLRRGELTSLTWDDIDLPACRLTVRGSSAKSGKTRHLPLNEEALDVLARYRAQHPEERLFNVMRVNNGFNTVLRAASIKDFRFHDLRHTFASNLVMAGVDLNTVRELLGHSDIKMTLRYAHLAPEHKAAAVALLGGGK